MKNSLLSVLAGAVATSLLLLLLSEMAGVVVLADSSATISFPANLAITQ